MRFDNPNGTRIGDPRRIPIEIISTMQCILPRMESRVGRKEKRVAPAATFEFFAGYAYEVDPERAENRLSRRTK
jgi:hypothetical protein